MLQVVHVQSLFYPPPHLPLFDPSTKILSVTPKSPKSTENHVSASKSLCFLHVLGTHKNANQGFFYLQIQALKEGDKRGTVVYSLAGCKVDMTRRRPALGGYRSRPSPSSQMLCAVMSLSAVSTNNFDIKSII